MPKQNKQALNRQFTTGANRNSEEGKIDPEGFLSPLVLEEFFIYMHKNRFLADGTFRDSDNWQKLFGEDHYSVCMKSLWRHFFDLWKEHRGIKTEGGKKDAINGILFNTMAYAQKLYKDSL